jgi:hypothetical protein
MKLRSALFHLSLRWHWYVLTPFFRLFPRLCKHPSWHSSSTDGYVTRCGRCNSVAPPHMQMCTTQATAD